MGAGVKRTGHRGRVDANHAAIVAALRAVGCSVLSLAGLGGGVPDLLVGVRGRTMLLEVKCPGEALRPLQSEWLRSWRGQWEVVDSVGGALAAVGLGSGGTSSRAQERSSESESG